MKKILFTLSLVACMFSCKTEPKKDYVVIKGIITNKKSDNLRLSSLNTSFRQTIKLNDDGTFLDTLKIDADNIMIYDGSNLTYLYLEAGNELSIKYDADDSKNTTNFTGNGAEINTYLVTKRNKESEVLGNSENVFELNETDFITKQKEIEATLLDLLNSSPNLPESYVEKEKRNIKYGYLSKLNNYESYHAYYTKKTDFKVSEGFLKELENLDYNNDKDYMFSYNYNNLVSSYCRSEAKKLSKDKAIENDVAYLKKVDELTNQTIKNDLLYKEASYGITSTNSLEDYYNAFMNSSSNEEHKKEITESYVKLKPISAGQPSPNFENYENYAGGTTSLNDLKGKYVYIDVWATWCGPCKGEIPYLKEVEKKYHDKNIEFVSISVDQLKDKDKWKKMVQDENLGGVQLMADNAFKSQFVQDYFIKGIPKFILLDPEGNIITPNAPRPSNHKLLEVFNSLNL